MFGEIRKGGKSLGNIWEDYDLIYGLLVLKSDCPADSSGASNHLWGWVFRVSNNVVLYCSMTICQVAPVLVLCFFSFSQLESGISHDIVLYSTTEVE